MQARFLDSLFSKKPHPNCLNMRTQKGTYDFLALFVYVVPREKGFLPNITYSEPSCLFLYKTTRTSCEWEDGARHLDHKLSPSSFRAPTPQGQAQDWEGQGIQSPLDTACARPGPLDTWLGSAGILFFFFLFFPFPAAAMEY